MSSTASIANRRRLEGCSIATALSIETLPLVFMPDHDFSRRAPDSAGDSARNSRGAEAAGAALGLVQRRLFRPLQPCHRRHHHLRDPIAALDGENILPVVDQNDAD